MNFNPDTVPGYPWRSVTVIFCVGVWNAVHSISNLAFDYLRIARDQINNGANTIFAIPIANARSNILTVEGDEIALGFFNVAAISRLDSVIEE